MDYIEEAWAILGERCWWKSRTDDGEREHIQAEKKAAAALVMAVLDAIEGEALQCPEININDYFVEDAIQPLRKRIQRVLKC